MPLLRSSVVVVGLTQPLRAGLNYAAPLALVREQVGASELATSAFWGSRLG
ncbi:MAG TPA: hypothetical protein VMH89_11120 [Candidatus Acidoferrum sp.]|nr:hypothetical protein [Candidatus Acidoferrum sp.]